MRSAASRIVHVVGARPNFMKVAPVMRALASREIRQDLVHTGQHYDRGLSDVFFDELGIPAPTSNLEVGSGSQAAQTAALLVALEGALPAFDPALVISYGDVNSTLATALVCAKLGLPTAHVEAGLRSFDRSMPEEINRVVTDALADLLFTTSPEAEDNLRAEGIDPARIHFVGNPMIDTLLANLDRFDAEAARRTYGLDGPYAVVTLHRPSNVDDPAAAAASVATLRDLSALLPVVFPVHPRGRAALGAAGLDALATRGPDGLPPVRAIDPLGYIEFLSLVRGAAVVVTDSGGIQEETTILGVPCLTLRPNTERPITISRGTNRLVTPADVGPIVRDLLASTPAPAGPPPPAERPQPAERPPLWDGHAGERIAAVLEDWLGARSDHPAAAGPEVA